jgi:hypothetical protein
MEAALKRRYPNYKLKGAYSGSFGFHKDTGTRIGLKKVSKALRSIPAYTLHLPRRIHFKRRRVYVPHSYAQWGMDLKDIQSESRYNNKKRYLLCVIDIFSKRGFLEALSNKTGAAVVKGLARIYARSGGVAPLIWSDFGREFFCKPVLSFLAQRGVKLFHVESELKCCVVERFIRTIFGKIQRYVTHNKTRKFVDKLQYFEDLYNNSYHRSIRMAPSQVTAANQEQVHLNLYARDKPMDYTPSKFKIGDTVLVAKRKLVFEKGYKQNYVKTPVNVVKVRETDPRVYILAEMNGSPIKGSFYAEQLVKINHL